MKKLLLCSLLMLVGASSAAWADTYELVTDASTLAEGDQIIVAGVNSNTYYAMSPSVSSKNPKIQATSVTCVNDAIELADGQTGVQVFTLATKTGETGFALKQSNGDKYVISTSSTNTDYGELSNAYFSAITISSKAATIKLNSSDRLLRLYNGSDFRAYSGTSNGEDVSIYRYVEPQATNVEKPTFTVTEGENSFSVAIAAEEGATIYYTTDQSNPSADASQVYTEAINFTDPIVVKAIAVKDGESSTVATFTSNKYLRADFADFLAGDASGDGVIKNTISAIYQNGSNLYVKANDTYMLVYGSLSSTLSNGDTFPRLAGTYTVYNGTPEFTNPVIGEVTTGGAAVEPEAVTDLSTLSSADCNKYVVLKGVSISGLKASDADDNTITIYNKFGLESIPEGSNLDVTGIVNYYVKGTSETLQVYPISVEGNIELGDIEADEAFEDGEAMITEGTTLTFKSNNAEAMVLTDADGETVVSAEGNTLEWTPEYGVYENYKVTATLGEASKEFAISYLDVVAKVVGDVVATYGADGTIEADGEVTVKQGAKLNFTAENALHVKLVTTDADNAQVVVAEAEGDALTWSPADVDADGTMYEVIAYRYEESAAKSMAFILYVEEAVPQESYDVFVDFSNQSWDKYTKNATITWTSDVTDVSGNPFSFATSCSIGEGKSTYAAIVGGVLKIYASNYNLVVVNAPTGYQISAVTFSVDTANSGNNIPYVDGNACTAAATDEGGEEEGGEEAAPHRAQSVFVDYSYEFDSAVTSFELEPSTSAVEGASANKNMAIASATITVSILPSAINTIAADSLLDNAAPVEYYNLQGQRVSNPANGLFIRRQGNNVTKVVIR
jgi:hypothetical protein